MLIGALAVVVCCTLAAVLGHEHERFTVALVYGDLEEERYQRLKGALDLWCGRAELALAVGAGVSLFAFPHVSHWQFMVQLQEPVAGAAGLLHVAMCVGVVIGIHVCANAGRNRVQFTPLLP